MSGDTQLPELPELTEATPYFLRLYLGFLDSSLIIVLSSAGARALALVGVPRVSDCIADYHVNIMIKSLSLSRSSYHRAAIPQA